MHSRQKPRAKARGRGGAPVGMMSQRRSRSAGQACGRKAQPGQGLFTTGQEFPMVLSPGYTGQVVRRRVLSS